MIYEAYITIEETGSFDEVAVKCGMRESDGYKVDSAIRRFDWPSFKFIYTVRMKKDVLVDVDKMDITDVPSDDAIAKELKLK